MNTSTGFGLAPIKREGTRIHFDTADSNVNPLAPATAWLEVAHTAKEFRELATILRKDKSPLAESMAMDCIKAAVFADWGDEGASK